MRINPTKAKGSSTLKREIFDVLRLQLYWRADMGDSLLEGIFTETSGGCVVERVIGAARISDLSGSSNLLTFQFLQVDGLSDEASVLFEVNASDREFIRPVFEAQNALARINALEALEAYLDDDLFGDLDLPVGNKKVKEIAKEVEEEEDGIDVVGDEDNMTKRKKKNEDKGEIDLIGDLNKIIADGFDLLMTTAEKKMPYEELKAKRERDARQYKEACDRADEKRLARKQLATKLSKAGQK